MTIRPCDNRFTVYFGFGFYGQGFFGYGKNQMTH